MFIFPVSKRISTNSHSKNIPILENVYFVFGEKFFFLTSNKTGKSFEQKEEREKKNNFKISEIIYSHSESRFNSIFFILFFS